MFKLPNGIPSVRTPAEDWADYAEYQAMTNNSVSLYNLVKQPMLVADEEFVEGVEDESDKYLAKTDEITGEIRFRINTCREKYPFELSDGDYVLSFSPRLEQSSISYCFMLLATRAKMSKDRIQGGLDGALLFERLCAVVIKNYFGPRSDVDILGTSKNEISNFRMKLKTLVKNLGEGGLIHENKGHKPQDEKVDVVAWKGFADNRPSKLIAFGQCKTGTSWTDKLTELSTESFCKTWFTDHPVVTPIRAFFTAQYFPRELFRVRANSAGLVFDRFRIIDFLPEDIGGELLTDIINWNSKVISFYQRA